MLLVPACAALVIAISSPADVSPTLVDHVFDETNAIWNKAGVTLVRQLGDEASGAPLAALDIVIGHQRGSIDGPNAALGWIEFDDGQPQAGLYLSYENALTLLESARGVVGLVSQMPILERETYLGRALGRALAHEIGHYLLAAKTHTASGLMKANFTAAELFMPEKRQFAISNAQGTIARAHVDRMPLVASARSGSSSPTSRQPASQPPATARWPGPIPH